MSKAGIFSLATFLAFALGGLALFFLAQPWLLGVSAFAAMGTISSVIASRVFNRIATPEEKRQELEDRVRNADL
jgi:membrane protein implicated in regulation of membrane protease activity